MIEVCLRVSVDSKPSFWKGVERNGFLEERSDSGATRRVCSSPPVLVRPGFLLVDGSKGRRVGEELYEASTSKKKKSLLKGKKREKLNNVLEEFRQRTQVERWSKVASGIKLCGPTGTCVNPLLVAGAAVLAALTPRDLGRLWSNRFLRADSRAIEGIGIWHTPLARCRDKQLGRLVRTLLPLIREDKPVRMLFHHTSDLNLYNTLLSKIGDLRKAELNEPHDFSMRSQKRDR